MEQPISSIYQVSFPEERRPNGVWISVGTFDGVHRGHQALIRRLVDGAHANDAPAVLITFFPHPSIVLRGQHGPFYLTPPEERTALLANLGVDQTITLSFDRQLASLTAFEFMTVLKEKIGVNHLLVGYNFALGRGREGDLPTLQKIGEQIGYQLVVIPPYDVGGAAVSSSQIRTWLSEGAVERAAQGLGRLYSVNGRVAYGDGRGRPLGIPTANLETWPEQVLPKIGVYACWVWSGNDRWKAVSNIGLRPTFEATPVQPRVEAHLLDFDRDIYGQDLRLEFVARLRDEQRFPSVDSLLNQIHQDIETARTMLDKTQVVGVNSEGSHEW